MHRYKITLKPQSFLLCASGEGRANIDTQIVFDHYGYPQIPARRLKGLLRESVQEVLEIRGEWKDKQKMWHTLFGQPGYEEQFGAIQVENLELTTVREAKQKSAHHLLSTPTLDKADLQAYFTDIVHQTALDNGVAKTHSLRTYAVLRHDTATAFHGDILTRSPLSTEQFKLLSDGCKHLRYIGSRRNRGFGKVKCTLTDRSLSSIKMSPSNEQVTKDQFIEVTLTTQSPIVIPKLGGDQNTVFTNDYFPGSLIRGLLAHRYINIKGVDEDFRSLFLRSLIHFGPCTIEGGRPLPQAVRKGKYREEYLNLFDTNVPSKAQDGYYWESRHIKVLKAQHFHTSRPQRSTGRSLNEEQARKQGLSTQSAGAIFYYESIVDGQTFKGKISGPPLYLNKLLTYMKPDFQARVGRSKSAQYGAVRVELNIKDRVNKSPLKGATLYLVAETPVLLIDEQTGQSSPTAELLEKSISGMKVMDTSAVSYTHIEQWNGQWKSKSDRYRAYDKGSCFEVKNIDPDRCPKAIGALQDQGFGKVYLVNVLTINQLCSTLEKVDRGSVDGDKIDILYVITSHKEARQREQQIRAAALTKAARAQYMHLSGHLISRLINAMDLDLNGLQQFYKDIKGKEAEKNLQSAFLLDDLKKITKATDEYNGLKEYKIFWRTFFNSLRKQNKTNG